MLWLADDELKAFLGPLPAPPPNGSCPPLWWSQLQVEKEAEEHRASAAGVGCHPHPLVAAPTPSPALRSFMGGFPFHL